MVLEGVAQNADVAKNIPGSTRLFGLPQHVLEIRQLRPVDASGSAVGRCKDAVLGQRCRQGSEALGRRSGKEP